MRIRISIPSAGIEATYTNRDPLGHWERGLEGSLSQEDVKLGPPATLPPQQIAALHLRVERAPGRGRGRIILHLEKKNQNLFLERSLRTSRKSWHSLLRTRPKILSKKTKRN